jgi:hypothetical protein
MRNLSLLSLLVFLTAAAQPAFAQAQMTPQKFDQYPSFLELTSGGSDGTQTILRCGYMVGNSGVVLDPDYQEVTVMNPGKGMYSRFQHIDTSIVATSLASANSQELMLELVRPDGSVLAKHCESDANTDTINNCTTVQAFAPAAQITGAAQQMYAQCETLLREGEAQINAATADPGKTEVFKERMRDKLRVLEGPDRP